MVTRPLRASPVPIPFQMAGTGHPCVSPGHSPGLLLTPAHRVVPAQAVPHLSVALPPSCPQSPPPPTWPWVSSPKGDTLEDRLLETVCPTDLLKHVLGAREGTTSSPGISVPRRESFRLLQLASLYQLLGHRGTTCALGGDSENRSKQSWSVQNMHNPPGVM